MHVPETLPVLSVRISPRLPPDYSCLLYTSFETLIACSHFQYTSLFPDALALIVTGNDLNFPKSPRSFCNVSVTVTSSFSDKEQLEFLQIWVFPRIENTEPEYNNYDIRPLLKRNELALIISPDGKVPASIKQDAWFSMGTFDAGKSFEYKLHQEGNGVYLFIIEGDVEVAGNRLSRRDGIGLWDTKSFKVEITQEATLLLMEVPMR